MNVNVNVNVKRKPGRRRRAAGWTLLVLGLLVAGVWVGSIFCAFGYSWTSWSVGAGWGSVVVSRVPRQDFVGWNAAALPPAVALQARTSRNPGVDFDVWIAVHSATTTGFGRVECWELVLWPVPPLLCTPGALLLRSGYLARRRANTGSCAKCGYSLAGLPADAPCPECGKAKTSLG